MCAIFGMGFLNRHRITAMNHVQLILDVLFRESQARGSRASGVTFTTPKEVAVIKKDLSAREMCDRKAYREACKKYMRQERLLSIVGHCRAPTKGSERDNNNNHPIVANRVIGVHNGIISNDDELFRQYGQIAGGEWRRSGMVDSEIIFRLLDYYMYTKFMDSVDAIKATSKELAGGYACAFVTTRDKYFLWLFRNHMPIKVIFYPKLGFLIFASSLDYIRTATEGINLGHEVEIEIPESSGVFIDLFNNKKFKFDLPEEKRRAGFLTA